MILFLFELVSLFWLIKIPSKISFPSVVISSVGLYLLKFPGLASLGRKLIIAKKMPRSPAFRKNLLENPFTQ